MEQVQMVTRIVTVHEEVFTEQHTPFVRTIDPVGYTFTEWLGRHQDWNQFHVETDPFNSNITRYGYHSMNGPEVTKWLSVEWKERA